MNSSAISGDVMMKWAKIWARKLCSALPKAAHLREELEQEAVIAIMKSQKRFDPAKGGFEHYAYLFAWEYMKRHVRRQGACVGCDVHNGVSPDTEGLTKPGADGEEYTPSYIDPGHSGGQEDQVFLRQQLARLKPNARAMVRARLQGLDLEEIGVMAGVSRETVRNEVAHAVNLMSHQP